MMDNPFFGSIHTAIILKNGLVQKSRITSCSGIRHSIYP